MTKKEGEMTSIQKTENKFHRTNEKQGNNAQNPDVEAQQSVKERKRMSRGVVATTVVFTLLFLGMIAYLAIYVYNADESEMIDNSYNTRQEVLTSQNYRGGIYASGGETLAYTSLDEEQNETRIYPYSNLFAHIVGYATNGRCGVESLANYYLITSDAPVSEKAANEAEGLKNPGNNVYTTLDLSLQQVAYDAMGDYDGAVIVTEVSTGKILAMVSKPDYDPNTISDDWDSIVSDPDSSVLLNRATQGLYPPGSTFKIITALEYIREHPEDYTDYTYTCTGSFRDGDLTIHCYHSISHGTLNLGESFAVSCNSSFANLGLTLDRESFAETLESLLFGEKLPIDLANYASSVEVSAETTDEELAQVVIGQGTTLMTPMHLHMITSAVANHGTLMIPYVIDHVENSAGTVIETFSATEYGQLMTSGEAAILQEMMIQVVEEGTGSRLQNDDYYAAGKTGSAEYSDTKGESHAWFTGFAPAVNPKICVTVILEGAGSGGQEAVPVAKAIFDAYLLSYTEE